LSPDEVTFCVLLRGYGARDPPDWPGMDAVLTRMRSQHGLEPGAACYNALLEVCYRTADSDRALDVIDRMAAEGIEPDSLTLDIVARKRTWRSYMRKTFG
jgi:pentatricopeptide repeat protein